MKKKLEAELISLAHRILQLKNKSEIAVLHEEARKLYEKLSVLRFAEEHFADAKPTIGMAEVEEKLENEAEEKVIVGEIPAEEEVPAANEISAMVENLAASKNVSEEFTADLSEREESENQDSDDETQEVEEPEAEVEAQEEAEVAAEAETEISASEEPTDEPEEKQQDKPEEIQDDSDEIVFKQPEPETEDSEEPKSEEPKEDSEEPKTEEIESPTFEEGTQLDQPEAVEEIKFAEEANAASALFWEAKPEDVPAAETNTEVPADSKQDDFFTPKFELSFDAKDDEIKKEDTPSPTFTFDDLLGKDYADPVFVKPEDLHKPEDKPNLSFTSEPVEEPKKEVIPITRSFDNSNVIPINKDDNRTISLNERLSKGITIGLNDRIAFMKNLFNNSSEDYNRVLSQLITFDNFGDAKNFIENIVKPDYGNWEGKEEYEQRFIEIVEKRFQ
ncbi:MAG: hypothetical protein EOO50_08305 [Flavobacterium sp.]|uniref:hypothetical protein n=1 Tax=Flavobacterium sp. TaxID=239 RepID=UPI0012124A28|nr:hypothetical protein [Flavobacterium sp.]RZJ66878.1 MAG: hypothetical protein EOO50_08305 [Flavobacterium sp.]